MYAFVCCTVNLAKIFVQLRLLSFVTRWNRVLLSARYDSLSVSFINFIACGLAGSVEHHWFLRCGVYICDFWSCRACSNLAGERADLWASSQMLHRYDEWVPRSLQW